MCWSFDHRPSLRWRSGCLAGVAVRGRSNVPDVATMKIARVPAANAKFELTDIEIPEPGRRPCPRQGPCLRRLPLRLPHCGWARWATGSRAPPATRSQASSTPWAKMSPPGTPATGRRRLVRRLRLHLRACRRGDFINCENGQVPGIAYDGGYAEYMVAPAEALARIPDDLVRCRRCAAAVRGHHDLQRTARVRRPAGRRGRRSWASAGSATSGSSSPPRWASKLSRSRAVRKRSRLRKSLARTTTSTRRCPTSPRS